MNWKHPFKSVSKETKRAGRQIRRSAKSTYASATDLVDDARQSVEKLTVKTYTAMGETVDDVIDATLQHVQIAVEARLEGIARDAQARVLAELDQRRFGLLLIGIGIGLAVLSSVLLTSGLVYVLVNVFNLPVWIAYLSLGLLFALGSTIFFLIGRRHLHSEE